ncbi:MAG: TMEM165/GDT1 family protein [Candidatus Altiarchaeota archaeon]
MINDFPLTAAAVGLAELGDKTQIAILLMSSKTKQRLRMLLGVMLAFAVVDGLAVLAGSFLSMHLPMQLIRTASAAVFILFGLLMLREGKDKDEGTNEMKNPLVSGFTIIFLMELGDKTQIAAGLLATKYDPLMVFAGALTALMALSATAAYFGKMISERINRRP